MEGERKARRHRETEEQEPLSQDDWRRWPSVVIPDLIFPDNFNTAKAMQRRVARADDLIENDEQIHGSYSSLRVILSNTSREAGGRVKETNRAPCLLVRSRRPCSREESRLWK